MKVVDLTEEHKNSYMVCLEDWSEEIKDVSHVKEEWYNKMKDQGLRVKLAQNEQGVVGGMIQYFPIEHSWIDGKDLYFIGCILVYGNKHGRGDFRNQGMGKAMVKAAEEDARQIGAKGIVAWGSSLPVWMKASWFKKQGYVAVDKKGLLGEVLLWKPFTEDAEPPKWIKQKKKPEKGSDKVKVTCLSHGWCPAKNLANERTKEVAAEFGDIVEVESINTFDKAAFDEWGVTDAIYIDGKKISSGAPPTKEKLRKIMENKARYKS